VPCQVDGRMTWSLGALARYALLLALALTGCSVHVPFAGEPRPYVLATTSTLSSIAQGVAGDRLRVRSLVPVGVSPEDYQPTPRDIETLHAADVLVVNGSGLEDWLTHTIDNAKNPALRIVNCTVGLPVVGGNPHLWMDPLLARAYVEKIRAAFALADPVNAATYRANASAYDAKLVALAARTQRAIDTIPPAQRAMIVFHSAFEYYNRRFGLRTVGILEASPGQEPSPALIAHIVTLARASGVRAVFAEPEYSPNLVEALAQSAHINTVKDLYDDSIGTTPAVSDYLSMIDYDTATIVKALK